MNQQEVAEILVECLGELNYYWNKMDSEWGPYPGGLEAAIEKGDETLIPKVRAAITALARQPIGD